MNGPELGTPSPLPITSRPVRARLDKVKAEMSAEFRARLGRDATWNEVLDRLLDVYNINGPGRKMP